jgi:hypothetical protein
MNIKSIVYSTNVSKSPIISERLNKQKTVEQLIGIRFPELANLIRELLKVDPN